MTLGYQSSDSGRGSIPTARTILTRRTDRTPYRNLCIRLIDDRCIESECYPTQKLRRMSYNHELLTMRLGDLQDLIARGLVVQNPRAAAARVTRSQQFQ